MFLTALANWDSVAQFPSIMYLCPALWLLFKQILPKNGKVNTWDRLKSIYFFFYTDFHWSELHHMVPSNSKRSWKICSYLEKSPWLLFVLGCLFWINFFFFLNILSTDIEREKRKGGRNEGRKGGKERRKRGKEGIKDSFTKLM